MATTSRRRPSRRRRALPALILAIALALPAVAACGSTEPRDLVESIKSGKVVLGTKYDQPGLGVQQPDGSVVGFDPSVSEYVVDHIADRLGVPHPEITWRETPSAQRETLIGNGEVDMIAATYSINEARAKKVAFAGPYLVTYQGLLVRKNDSSLNSLMDLNNGKKLCSVSGSTPAQNVKAQLPGVQLQEYDSYSSCVEALRRDKVDALTTDETILAGYANRYPGEFKLVSMTYPKDACVGGKLKKKGQPFSTERYGIGMAKNYPDSVAKVNEALEAMLAPLPGSDQSVWSRDLRDALGNETIDSWIARADAPGSQYKLFPDVGNLDFLTSPSTPCEGDA
ncbi:MULTISPECIES: glutamate ABC transporter substrate-binding protein [Gordonia]|uniref:Glutamate ABC transporter substrate-binding protein n=1 Tax=Gordonia cholesterolivorans TaxID=559625 RepID=A0ABN3HA84_9ACTN|nr:glutamate ABC transporter substrate-binding protein [Gordonia sihwensis]WFN94482.1 glutamate ABC transporter substrate-binding protein [Gordonia sihwensis]